MRLLVLFDVCVSAECFLSGLICVASRVYLYNCIMYCVCMWLHWEYMLSLTTGWTWGNGAAASLPLSDCRIHQPLPVTKTKRLEI